MRRLFGSRVALWLLFWVGVSLLVVSCGDPGADGLPGLTGSSGADGADGDDGITGDTGLGVEITDRHGTEMLLTTGEYETAGKYFATATIISATANTSGVATVNFTVEDEDGDPAPGITGIDFGIAALFPASGGESFNKWYSYVYRTATASAAGTNPAGTLAEQAYRENGGTFADYGDGSYSYVFDTDLSTVTTPVSSVDVTYDRSFTHRVSVMIGGHSGATADANFDFVPDGSSITETRDIVQTTTCIKCHGVEFHGHGGDRLTMENCVTCHNAPGGSDPEGGALMDMTVMIHKIHAGGELASIPGVDGIVFDDPATGIDESADNGAYTWWGHRDSEHSWEKTAFPAVIQNCTACHEGTGADVANWMTVPSRLACGSCHDDVDFTDGTNHLTAGAQANDNGCAGCHPDSGSTYAVTDAHDWTVKDPRHIMEFQVDITVSAPATGDYFVAGESPVISIVLRHDDDGDATWDTIDHTTVIEDTDNESNALPRDGLFDTAYLFVQGPRAKFNPVLTTRARVEVVSTTDLTFDLSTSGASLDLVVDGGQDLLSFDPATPEEDILLVSDISVDVTDGVQAAIIADPAAVTQAEIVDWLNADADFAGRCIAYIDGSPDTVAIRSRNLGDFFSLQLEACEVNTVVFGGNTTVQVVGGYYPSNAIYQHALAIDDDPKADWTTDQITYTLDPVDDLKPGTYVVSVEIKDRGKLDDDDYTTPSVASATFQVGTATEEAMVATNCGACHESTPGRGYVLDFVRHHKKFGDDAVDMCAACHDYQSGKATGAWYGGKPISKRTHAVHRGAYLNYPNTTVDHEDTIAGRNWAIHFPQDIRNCESCHTDATSGSWMTGAARLPCQGCHDSDAVTTHMLLQTWDPTPDDPWSGDEQESCKMCH